jgi:hypothetical protein
VNIVRSGFQNFNSWERCESESDSETRTKGNINIRPWSGCCKSGRMFTTTPGVSSIIVDSISGCLRDVKKMKIIGLKWIDEETGESNLCTTVVQQEYAVMVAGNVPSKQGV